MDLTHIFVISTLIASFLVIIGSNGAGRSFFSSTSFHPKDKKDWSGRKSLAFCKTEGNQPLLYLPIEDNFNVSLIPGFDKWPALINHFADLAWILIWKIPTPIQLTGNNLGVFKYENVTKKDRTLFFITNPPTNDYYVSFYTNRTDFPFLPTKTDHDYKSKTQIELSTVRAVTLSINYNVEIRNTRFYGLGKEEDVDVANEKHYNFVNAVFLGAPKDVAGFASHKLLNYPDRKKEISYPMEIYMYFQQQDCDLPECAIQLVALVEESNEENKQVKPIVDMVQESNVRGLFKEEVKFIQTYNAQDLGKYTDKLFDFDGNKDLYAKSWLVHTYLEFLHTVHFLRVDNDDLFKKVNEIHAKRMSLFHDCMGNYPWKDDVVTANPSVNVALLDQIETNVGKLMLQLFVFSPSNELGSSLDYIFCVNPLLPTCESVDQIDVTLYSASLKNLTLTNVWLSAEIKRDIMALGLDVTQEFSGTTFKGFAPEKRKPDAKTTFKKFQEGLLAYTSYYFSVVIPNQRKLVDVSLRYQWAGGTWETVMLNKHTDGFLTLRKQLGELPTIDPKFYQNNNKHKLLEKARNNVPRIQLKDKFQISWLIPDVGGHYIYRGSTPFPPCHEVTKTVVFEKPIQMSREQIRILSRVPYGEKSGDVITSTRPIFHDVNSMNPSIWTPTNIPNPLIKYNLKNHQFLGQGNFPDEFHEHSIQRAKGKKTGK